MKRLFFASLLIMGAVSADSCFDWQSYYPAVNDGDNVWIEVDLLYWKPWEKAVVATNKKSNVFATDDFTKTSAVHPHFQWDLGYRLSSGYLFSSELWTVEGSWTHYHSHVSQNRSSHGSSFIGMFPIWSLSEDVITGDYVFKSDLHWKLTVNLLDLQFVRYWKPLSWLEINPYLGIRSAWIKQHGNVEYQGGMFLIGILFPGLSLNGTDFIKMKNDYWGLGPRLGIAPRILLGRGFSLNNEAAIAGLYGFFETSQHEKYLKVTRFSKHQHLNRFRWIADLAAGIQWKTLFDQDRYALTFKADWEYHLFFHQFELKKDRFRLVPKNRNLSLQGVTFSVRFDF